MKFEVGDLVRIKPRESVAPCYWNAVGSISDIYPNTSHPYTLLIHGVEHFFAEDELEKI